MPGASGIRAWVSSHESWEKPVSFIQNCCFPVLVIGTVYTQVEERVKRENRLKQDSRYILRVTDLEHELMHTPAQPTLNKNNAIYSCLGASF